MIKINKEQLTKKIEDVEKKFGNKEISRKEYVETIVPLFETVLEKYSKELTFKNKLILKSTLKALKKIPKGVL